MFSCLPLSLQLTRKQTQGCFVAALLAMTIEGRADPPAEARRIKWILPRAFSKQSSNNAGMMEIRLGQE